MATDGGEFKRSLVRLLQAGSFQDIVGCVAEGCTKVEFREETLYTVTLQPKTIVVREQEREVVRQYANGRWKPVTPTPTVFDRGRIVIDRASGRILETPSWGVARPVPVRRKRQRQRNGLALARV